MKRAPALAALLAAACSDGGPTSRAPEDVPPSGAVVALEVAVAASRAEVGQIGSGGAGLRGDVNGLTADNSDLNVRVTDLGTMVELPTDTLFAFDSAELGPEAEPNLLKAAELVRRGGPGSVGVVGHTDANGGDP